MFLIAVTTRLSQKRWEKQTKFQGMKKGYRNVALPSGCEVCKGRMVSEQFFFSFYQYERLQGKKLLLPIYQSELLSLFTSRKNKEGSYNEKQSKYWQSYSEPEGKFYKEFTCESNCKNCFGNISKIFRSKFTMFICYHVKIIEKILLICQVCQV